MTQIKKHKKNVLNPSSEVGC